MEGRKRMLIIIAKVNTKNITKNIQKKGTTYRKEKPKWQQ